MKGFSLLEVLIALTVLSGALIFTAKETQMSFRNFKLLEDKKDPTNSHCNEEKVLDDIVVVCHLAESTHPYSLSIIKDNDS